MYENICKGRNNLHKYERNLKRLSPKKSYLIEYKNDLGPNIVANVDDIAN